MIAFAFLYLLLFRAELRVGRFLLVMVPAALMLSWAFNVVRISVLVAIGAHFSPALAVGGFHSYAGWMAFTLLALALLVASHMIPWFRRQPAAPARPWRQDWVVACILPFIALTLADVLVAMALPEPALGYPLKLAVGLASLYPFRGLLLRLPWSLDPVALFAGVGVAAGWLAFAPPAVPVAGVATLAPMALAAWAVLRIVGTTLVVPVVEELFFRGYILGRFDRGTRVSQAVGVAVSSILFALLHGRWLAAGLAGVVFALVVLRRGRLSDAILAHATANGLIAVWALLMRDWSLI